MKLCPLSMAGCHWGEFQRIFAVELDAEKALQVDHRTVLVQVLGV